MPIQLLNPATKETLNYFPTNNYLHDNQAIPNNINDIDGVIYLKDSGNYYVLEDFMGGNPINARRFGTFTDKGYSSLAINKAIKLTKEYNYKSLYVPSGDYKISETIIIDVSDDTTIIIDGQLMTVSDFTGTEGIIIQRPPIDPIINSMSGLNIKGLNCSAEKKDYSNPIGIKIADVIFSTIEIKRVTGFGIGTLLYSDNGNGGISYNSFYLNYFHNNTTNLKFEKGDDEGYINENIFYGGSFNHTKEFLDVITYNIYMQHNSKNLNPYNNNRFFIPHLKTIMQVKRLLLIYQETAIRSLAPEWRIQKTHNIKSS